MFALFLHGFIWFRFCFHLSDLFSHRSFLTLWMQPTSCLSLPLCSRSVILFPRAILTLYSQHLLHTLTRTCTRATAASFSQRYFCLIPIPGVRYAHWLRLPTCSLLAQTSRAKPHLVIIGGQSPQDSKGLGQAGDCNEQSRGWRPDRHQGTYWAKNLSVKST